MVSNFTHLNKLIAFILFQIEHTLILRCQTGEAKHRYAELCAIRIMCLWYFGVTSYCKGNEHFELRLLVIEKIPVYYITVPEPQFFRM